jgi:hypothetical protein
MKRICILFVALAGVASPLAGVRADEGMWTFDNVPRALIKRILALRAK